MKFFLGVERVKQERTKQERAVLLTVVSTGAYLIEADSLLVLAYGKGTPFSSWKVVRRRGAGRCGCGGKTREGGLGKYFKYIFHTVTDADEQEELFVSN